MPTFTVDELKKAVEDAASSGRIVAAHATTAEGMRRAYAPALQQSSMEMTARRKYLNQ